MFDVDAFWLHGIQLVKVNVVHKAKTLTADWKK